MNSDADSELGLHSGKLKRLDGMKGSEKETFVGIRKKIRKKSSEGSVGGFRIRPGSVHKESSGCCMKGVLIVVECLVRKTMLSVRPARTVLFVFCRSAIRPLVPTAGGRIGRGL